jgi:hypothetical protein
MEHGYSGRNKPELNIHFSRQKRNIKAFYVFNFKH